MIERVTSKRIKLREAFLTLLGLVRMVEGWCARQERFLFLIESFQFSFFVNLHVVIWLRPRLLAMNIVASSLSTSTSENFACSHITKKIIPARRNNFGLDARETLTFPDCLDRTERVLAGGGHIQQHVRKKKKELERQRVTLPQ
jgi:hypothetical protein